MTETLAEEPWPKSIERHIMGMQDFGWRRIRDNICLLKPSTIHAIVAEGHRLVCVQIALSLRNTAAKQQRITRAGTKRLD